MTREQVEAGKRWVQETLLCLASEKNIQAENVAWKGPSDDPRHFDRISYFIYFDVSDKADRESLEFSRGQLEDCPEDKNEQRNLKNKIRAKLTSLLKN